MNMKRQILKTDVRKLDLQQMPGFNLTWYYTGLEAQPDAFFASFGDTKAFIRYNTKQGKDTKIHFTCIKQMKSHN